jgi:carbamoyl-phosphate synthase/aspartate carbamoyltransferase/dihydroorotase
LFFYRVFLLLSCQTTQQGSFMRLPGLIDVHVHLREPGATHKEDWDSGTAAALAGGFTLILAMPNTQPPVTDAASLELALSSARQKARCDYAQYVGAGPDNAALLPDLAQRAAGLKMYLDQTYGPLRLDDMRLWMDHFLKWPHSFPIAAHAESRTLAAVILMAALYDRPVHLCHISRQEEITLIRKAKEAGVKVTCEVTPHHLFLSEEDIPAIGAGRAEVRPRLTTLADRESLWQNLDVIDCFATDHAPHTLNEKDGLKPPPGFPGLETALPLFLTAVSEGRLSFDDLILRMYTNPRRIFNLPEQPETYIEVDPDAAWQIQASQTYTRCAWTPFEGRRVRGRLRWVVLRGVTAYNDGQVLSPPGSGLNIRS